MSVESDVEDSVICGETDENFSSIPSIDEKCRLCLKETEPLIPVATTENGSYSTVALKIDILTSVKVAPTDKICMVCRMKVKRFYSFRIMCIQSDARIRGTLKRRQEALSVDPEALLPSDVSVVQVHGDPIKSYKRQRRIESTDKFYERRKPHSEGLSIIPMSEGERNCNIQAFTKMGSSLTISPVPIKKETEENGNGQEAREWNNHEDESEFRNDLGYDVGVKDHSSSGDETENLEVQIDPFMLMEDDTSDQEQQNAAVNVRGQMLYPVLGTKTNSQRPFKPNPPVTRGGADRERAIELIKQMTTQRAPRRSTTSALDGSFLDKPFKCDICPESFSYYKSFVKHKQRHSGELQTFKCDFCPDIFQTSRQLQNHLKYHNVEKAFPCDQCERSFPTKERLQSHYTLHTGKKPHVCEICHKSFAYKSSYGLHIRKLHGEQPIKSQTFKCDKCYEEFDIFVDFKRHLRTHQGEKPFTCHVCNKAFASKSILNVHSRIHNGFKPYKCEICGQAFTQKQSLDYHMRRHSEENPFKCDFCGMTFQRRYFLEKHREAQHGVIPNSTLSGDADYAASVDDDGGEHHMDAGAIEGENVIDQEDDDTDTDPLKLEIVDSSVEDEESIPVKVE